MSKRVLIISSSPRKGGNSDTLCDQFKKGAEEAGNVPACRDEDWLLLCLLRL